MTAAMKMHWASRPIQQAPWINGNSGGTFGMYRVYREQLLIHRGRWAKWPYALFRRKTAEDTAWSINTGNRRSFPADLFEARVDYVTGELWVRARPRRGDEPVEDDGPVTAEEYDSWVELPKVTHPYEWLSPTQRSNIRRELRDGKSARSLAIKFGVTIKTINKIGGKS